MKFFSFNRLLVCALFLCCLHVAGTVHLTAQDAKSKYEEFDKLCEQGKIPEAQKLIESLKSANSKDYEVLHRYSRVLVLAGDLLPDKTKQEETYVRAKEIADQAIAVNPNGMWAYIRRAAANGKIALFKGVFSVGGLVKQVRDDAEKAIQLNNAGPIPLSIAHYILGRTHMKVSEKGKIFRMPLGLGWANIDDALAHLKKACELRWGFLMYHLDYARALEREDRYSEAKQQLQVALGAKYQEFGDDARKKEAQELWNEIKDKN